MQTILNQLKIKADVVNIEDNGTISKYYLKLHPGTKVSKIENSSTEIALGIKAFSKPIIRVITEKGLVAIELLTKPVQGVSFSDLLEEFNSKKDFLPLPMILGKTHDGINLVSDLSIMPHLLIAGTTGSGKSVMLHSILNSFVLLGQNNVRMALIDPKKVEFSYYSKIDQLLYPVVTEPDDALDILSDLVDEMENRFAKMSRVGVNTIHAYNENNKRLPYIVLMIDEFSDLIHMSGKLFQKKLCMLAQKSRACGIHIIMATQRPSADVVTGLIKANFPSRISCKVSSNVDSRVILNCGGAEKLLGKGDSIINSIGLDMVRFQGAYINTDDINNNCETHNRKRFFSFLDFLKGG